MKNINENLNVKIPKSWIKKIIPYILAFILSGGSYAGVNYAVSSEADNYSEQINDLNIQYSDLNSRLINVEGVQKTILVQLSDIKDQGKTNQNLSNEILLILTKR